jgi:putative tryptophan/tyrosine transport system substrate-binding protein
LAHTGYVEGRNLRLETRSTEHYDQVRALAAELVERQVAVIGALGGLSAPAAKKTTSTIPIVFSIGGDPIELGLVSSVNRPGGNITGVTFFTAQLLQKQVEILHELLPTAATLGTLINPNNPRHEADANDVQAAGRKLGIDVHIARAGDQGDFGAAFASLVQRDVQALIIAGDALFLRARPVLAALAMQHAVPSIMPAREYPGAGGLMSYGASLMDAYHQAGVYAGRILKGERPGDLPIMQPSRFEFVINLKTATALRLEVPATLLARADEVIE